MRDRLLGVGAVSVHDVLHSRRGHIETCVGQDGIVIPEFDRPGRF